MFGPFGFLPLGGVVPPGWAFHHMQAQKAGAEMMAAAAAAATAGAFLVGSALIADELQQDEPVVHAYVDGKPVKSYVVMQ